MVKIRIIVSLLFLCSQNSLQAQFSEIKRVVLSSSIKSIDLYGKFGAGKPSEGTGSAVQKNAIEWGVGCGASFALGKRWDLLVVFAIERGKILSKGAIASIQGIEGGKQIDIIKQESRLKYSTLSVMPRFYLDRKERFFAGIGAYVSNVHMSATDWTDSEGKRYEGLSTKLNKDYDYGMLLYIGVKFYIRERPFEAGLCYRYGFVDFQEPLNGAFRMNSLFGTLKTPVYIFKKNKGHL